MRHRPGRARQANAASGVGAAQSESGVEKDTPAQVVGFASLKGGVGKTTLALVACEVRRKGLGGVSPSPVVLIDADVAGTEVHWVLDERRYVRSSVPLIDILKAAPDDDRSEQRLVEEVRALRASQVLVVTTFANLSERRPETLIWKQVLERSGLYARQRLRTLLARLCRTEVNVRGRPSIVVDLPAFDVGFATEGRAAIGDLSDKRLAGGAIDARVRLVSDFDRRSIREVWAHLLNRPRTAKAPRRFWLGVCVNEADAQVIDEISEQSARDWMAGFSESPPRPARGRARARGLVAVPVPILCPRSESLRTATSVRPTLTVESQIEQSMRAMRGHAARLWTDPSV